MRMRMSIGVSMRVEKMRRDDKSSLKLWFENFRYNSSIGVFSLCFKSMDRSIDLSWRLIYLPRSSFSSFFSLLLFLAYMRTYIHLANNISRRKKEKKKTTLAR